MKKLPPSPRGFTLIELLIVVAIIAILAAIAVPNFLEAQVRAKVSRTKSDMRSIATAVESYRVDHNNYPYVTHYFPEPYAVPAGHYMGDQDRAFGLTSPVAYLTSIPQDPFGGARDPNDVYAQFAGDDYYWSTKAWFDLHNFPWRVEPAGEGGPTTQWVLQSKGPDRAWGTPPSLGGVGAWELDQPYKYHYDPTNGTISLGNIVRSGP